MTLDFGPMTDSKAAKNYSFCLAIGTNSTNFRARSAF